MAAIWREDSRGTKLLHDWGKKGELQKMETRMNQGF